MIVKARQKYESMGDEAMYWLHRGIEQHRRNLKSHGSDMTSFDTKLACAIRALGVNGEPLSLSAAIANTDISIESADRMAWRIVHEAGKVKSVDALKRSLLRKKIVDF